MDAKVRNPWYYLLIFDKSIFVFVYLNNSVCGFLKYYILSKLSIRVAQKVNIHFEKFNTLIKNKYGKMVTLCGD